MASNPDFYFKPGDDIAWMGKLVVEGQTSFVGYQLKAHFRAKIPKTGCPGNLLTAASSLWTDAAAGEFKLVVSREDTAKWPDNITVMLDISVLNPAGIRVRSETLEFKTKAGITTSV